MISKLLASIILLPCVLSFTIFPFHGDILPKASRRPSVLFETRETDLVDATASPSRSSSIKRPAIHWTVPGYKVGWRDEDGNWFDVDGPRNGPPQNYWRQMSDEREYNRDMEALASVLNEINMEERVCALEKRLGTRKPSLSRKLLGSWAPILQGGKKVALNDKPADDEGSIEVPYKMSISRTDGPRFAAKNHYGIFYAKLEVGERLTIETSNNSLCKVITVDDTNDPNPLGYVELGASEHLLFTGGISYVSDYLLIQRNAEGALDIWVRCDDSYLGFREEEVQQ